MWTVTWKEGGETREHGGFKSILEAKRWRDSALTPGQARAAVVFLDFDGPDGPRPRDDGGNIAR